MDVCCETHTHKVMKKIEPFICKEYSDVFEKLHNTILAPSLTNEIHPLFYAYYASVIATEKALSYYVMDQCYLFEILRIKGKEVLEIGCGFGLNLICQSLFGAKKSTGIDISKEMISGFRVLLDHLPQLNIEAKLEDFLLADSLNNSFDVIILSDAISHIRDTTLLLDRIQRILRPGGVLFIRDGNNDVFLPSKFQSRRKLWKLYEYGPVPEINAKYGREVDRLSWFDARMKIIKNVHPSLDEKTLQTIAKKTQGLYGDTVVKASDEFLATGKIQEKPSFSYRNPYTGETMELGLNPFRLTKELERRHFQCRFLMPLIYRQEADSGLPLGKHIAVKIMRNIAFLSPNVLLPFLYPLLQIVALRETPHDDVVS
jgi:SAM-dependent methyltransferase